MQIGGPMEPSLESLDSRRNELSRKLEVLGDFRRFVRAPPPDLQPSIQVCTGETAEATPR